MSRLGVLAGCMLLVVATLARGDAFDYYINPVLSRLVDSKNVQAVEKVTPRMLVEYDRVLPRANAAFLIVRTNGNRLAKLLVTAGRQRIEGDKSLPILSIERFVTYKEGEEQTILASGTNQSLYEGFRFSFDLGQVVPEAVGGDLRFVLMGDKMYAEPIGKAKIWIVTQHDPSVIPAKKAKFVMGDKFEASAFTGTYRLFDDGRRSGKLVLKLEQDGRTVVGWYYSDRDGQKYEVRGRLGVPLHAIEFTVKFPRTEQFFKGMLFTGDGKALAGTSRLIDREAAFYALREE
jgi:hypothetical protein